MSKEDINVLFPLLLEHNAYLKYIGLNFDLTLLKHVLDDELRKEYTTENVKLKLFLNDYEDCLNIRKVVII
jgi:hypothetical protein